MNNTVVALAAVVLLALGALLVWFNANTQAQPEPEEAQAGVYSSSAYSFGFSYPSEEFSVREYQPYMVAVGVPRDDDAFDSWVNVEVVSSDTEAYGNFDEFLAERAKTLCAADGPGESIECSRVIETQPFTSAEGAEGRELFLELLWHDLEAQSTATSTFGPLYAFAMATSTAEFMALLVYQPLPSMLAQEDPAAVASVAQTISLSAAQ